MGKRTAAPGKMRQPPDKKGGEQNVEGLSRAILKQIEDLLNRGIDAETILAKIIESIKEMLK